MKPRAVRGLEALSRAELARLGREFMLHGHVYDRALMPQAAMRLGGGAAIEPLSIAEWQGASPNYTRRMRRLMRIEGDDVASIVKALQLDVGFPHEYMDVRFALQPDGSAEFELRHCGALMDVEPRGEKAVVMMCHRIEDPTFDATAVATNPRARMRPVHRPPRIPADRQPHCRWTIRVEPHVAPIVEAPLTLEVGALPLARVANERPAEREPGGWHDYAGAFDPAFRLEQLAHGTLVAVLREFSLQAHLLAAAADLFLSQQHDRTTVRTVLTQQWIGASWITAERIAALRGLAGGGIEAIAETLALHPAFPPGVGVRIEVADDRRLRLDVEGASDLLSANAPGWLGLLAAGEAGSIDAIARAVNPRARATCAAPGRFEVVLDASAEPAKEPPAVALTRLSTVAAFRFRDFA